MAATHSASTLLASVACAANGSQISSTLNLTAAYGALLIVNMTNGGTAPAVACTATINIGPDGSSWYQFAQATAGTTASTAYPLVFEIPPQAMYVQVVFSGNTGQPVTVGASAQTLTGL
jgi:hypothetical protein